jgi:hypothetical protein
MTKQITECETKLSSLQASQCLLEHNIIKPLLPIFKKHKYDDKNIALCSTFIEKHKKALAAAYVCALPSLPIPLFVAKLFYGEPFIRVLLGVAPFVLTVYLAEFIDKGDIDLYILLSSLTYLGISFSNADLSLIQSDKKDTLKQVESLLKLHQKHMYASC